MFLTELFNGNGKYIHFQMPGREGKKAWHKWIRLDSIETVDHIPANQKWTITVGGAQYILTEPAVIERVKRHIHANGEF